MVVRGVVQVRCDVLLKVLGELDKDERLLEIFGSPVSRSLVVVADGNDLRVENGGALKLSKADSKRFLDCVGRIVKSEGFGLEGDGAGRQAAADRVRVRCDVLEAILKGLAKQRGLEALFGMPVLEALVAIADGGDFRIETASSIKLTEAQKSAFVGLLNQVITDNTS